jgi:hypothetical protein
MHHHSTNKPIFKKTSQFAVVRMQLFILTEINNKVESFVDILAIKSHIISICDFNLPWSKSKSLLVWTFKWSWKYWSEEDLGMRHLGGRPFSRGPNSKSTNCCGPQKMLCKFWLAFPFKSICFQTKLGLITDKYNIKICYNGRNKSLGATVWPRLI